ncbi:Limonene-1,2-epoxide hydrolase catalytic domain protein [Bernardetia litoralis DSM 6794]|uniref:Limonene-1,2-epoxide hydrolase catalytic domain protein n=1 Tax=Bernardetia litoralis (strain ATCC 23117 / DSM 6794 / NBRC 15988 / NCIMB 1366 / Fx l1 / Sio-4) TaxID=880071 RepID=I4AJQ0_BERLS|nr:nuclear transport factor 2 family protein [Bernardetia litoralis]AFM04185.1 Limonene-1,2-epoxide hydrolase catalytic domain protein [Bernardetia litoralis DSM 6794]
MNSREEKEQLITDFYTAFINRDAEKMVSYYDDDIVFNDPIFKNLKGEEAKDMWRMLLSSPTEVKVSFSNVEANGIKGSANWEAIYPFSKTGNTVHNKIKAQFEFENGKIIRHTDDFDLWKWSGMALGISGKLLGWTSLLQNKVRDTAQQNLDKYRESKK